MVNSCLDHQICFRIEVDLPFDYALDRQSHEFAYFPLFLVQGLVYQAKILEPVKYSILMAGWVEWAQNYCQFIAEYLVLSYQLDGIDSAVRKE